VKQQSRLTLSSELHCVTSSSENEARSILSRAKNRSDDGDSDDAKAANIHADCSGRLRVPGRGARPLIGIHPPSPRRVIAARYRCEPRTVFGALNRRICIRCPKPILEGGCDINRQGRQDESRRRKIPRGRTDKAIRAETRRGTLLEPRVSYR